MATYVDIAALVIEVLRAAGIRAELEPPSNETARTALTVVQDASPVSVRTGPVGAATKTVVSLTVVSRDRADCAAVADAAVTALVKNTGSYTKGRLIKGRATNLPRPVGQNMLVGDNLHQRHAMVHIIAGHPDL